MKLSRRAVAAAFVATAVLIAGAVQASPITMGPNPITINGLNGTFTISLQSGDTATNRLNFGVLGSNPPGMAPAFGIAAVVFHGASVVQAGEISDPHNLITGISLPGSGTVAGVLVDFGAPSSASFFVRLNGTPTSADWYSLASPTTSFASVTNYPNCSSQSYSFSHYSSCKKSPYKQKITTVFHADRPGNENPIPEPSATLCFAAGLTLVASRLRRP